MPYQAPIAEQIFVLKAIADIRALSRLPRFASVDETLTGSLLAESARLVQDIFVPLNRIGDKEGVKLVAKRVIHPEGFSAAYRAYIDGEWASLSADASYGGQGLPFTLGFALNEQLTSANMAFSLCMLLSAGAIDAIAAHGSSSQKALYLPKLISGEWTGTMNLTEPQAGSDVGALRTIATPAGDGSWRIKGSTIFITWGEHELAENIVHLVLARTPDSPSGTKGLSLFVVPKFLPNAENSPGMRNDLYCASIEHKLGIHASPTCTINFGENDQCVGWLIGAQNAGMNAMFTMMNSARINVGLQGVAIAERAYQGALEYARERVQSIPVGGSTPARIIEHPDVRRMLMTMRATTQAIRAIAYFNASAIDKSRAEIDAEKKSQAIGLADLLTPITKAYATDMGVQMANLGLQVYGGMGYIEETGAAQHLRDIRIAPIYEGTNGIQALDLVGRKLHIQDGIHWRRLFDEMRCFYLDLPAVGDLGAIRTALTYGVTTLKIVTETVVEYDPRTAAAIATPFLKMFGIVLGAYLLSKQARVASESLAISSVDEKFMSAKIATARFFVEELLPEALALERPILEASMRRLFSLTEEQLAV